MGFRRGAAWGCAGARAEHCAAPGRGVGMRRGAVWGYAGAQGGAAHGAAQGRSSVGLRTGAVAWGCAGAQQHGAARGHSAGLLMGAA